MSDKKWVKNCNLNDENGINDPNSDCSGTNQTPPDSASTNASPRQIAKLNTAPIDKREDQQFKKDDKIQFIQKGRYGRIHDRERVNRASFIQDSKKDHAELDGPKREKPAVIVVHDEDNHQYGPEFQSDGRDPWFASNKGLYRTTRISTDRNISEGTIIFPKTQIDRSNAEEETDRAISSAIQLVKSGARTRYSSNMQQQPTKSEEARPGGSLDRSSVEEEANTIVDGTIIDAIEVIKDRMAANMATYTRQDSSRHNEVTSPLNNGAKSVKDK